MYLRSFLSLAPLLLFTQVVQHDAHEEVHTLYVAHFDDDAIYDTLVGIATGDLRMLATEIHWGTMRSDDARVGVPVQPRLELRYPEASSLEGSCAVEDINGDGIDDIVLVYDTCSSSKPCSQRAVVIVGQRALRSMDVIDVGSIPDGVQWRPFVAVDVGVMGLLQEPAEREHSGSPSYAWCTIPLPVRDSAGLSSTPQELADVISLYPNPAATMATFAAGRLAPGEYFVELLDANGRLRYARRVVAEVERSVSGTIDLAREAAGVYIVRIRSGKRVVATYPVVVVR